MDPATWGSIWGSIGPNTRAIVDKQEGGEALTADEIRALQAVSRYLDDQAQRWERGEEILKPDGTPANIPKPAYDPATEQRPPARPESAATPPVTRPPPAGQEVDSITGLPIVPTNVGRERDGPDVSGTGRDRSPASPSRTPPSPPLGVPGRYGTPTRAAPTPPASGTKGPSPPPPPARGATPDITPPTPPPAPADTRPRYPVPREGEVATDGGRLGQAVRRAGGVSTPSVLGRAAELVSGELEGGWTGPETPGFGRNVGWDTLGQQAAAGWEEQYRTDPSSLRESERAAYERDPESLRRDAGREGSPFRDYTESYIGATRAGQDVPGARAFDEELRQYPGYKSPFERVEERRAGETPMPSDRDRQVSEATLAWERQKREDPESLSPEDRALDRPSRAYIEAYIAAKESGALPPADRREESPMPAEPQVPPVEEIRGVPVGPLLPEEAEPTPLVTEPSSDFTAMMAGEDLDFWDRPWGDESGVGGLVEEEPTDEFDEILMDAGASYEPEEEEDLGDEWLM